jgi:hypothetical protein
LISIARFCNNYYIYGYKKQELKVYNSFEIKAAAKSPAKIIPFPGLKGNSSYTDNAARNCIPLTPFHGEPGSSLPVQITDYRPFLQRDGLILLSWDKRASEIGERYTAYWVTSSGIPRFYASKPLCQEYFYFAKPDHKSYAADDGIEFYGQKSPEYIVYVAPELMKSNPRHGELRDGHIGLLKHHGSKVDFSYKYLLKNEKKSQRQKAQLLVTDSRFLG